MNHLSDLISVVKRGAARGTDYNRPARQNRARVRPKRKDASSARQASSAALAADASLEKNLIKKVESRWNFSGLIYYIVVERPRRRLIAPLRSWLRRAEPACMIHVY